MGQNKRNRTIDNDRRIVNQGHNDAIVDHIADVQNQIAEDGTIELVAAGCIVEYDPEFTDILKVVV